MKNQFWLIAKHVVINQHQRGLKNGAYSTAKPVNCRL